jgi:hypothetical protein
MAFDTKAPTPKVLFSPYGRVEDDVLQIIARQSKSPAAEAAVKMNVFQSDSTGDAEVAAPARVREEVAETPEPTKRESTKTSPSDEKQISDVVKKWSKK